MMLPVYSAFSRVDCVLNQQYHDAVIAKQDILYTDWHCPHYGKECLCVRKKTDNSWFVVWQYNPVTEHVCSMFAICPQNVAEHVR